MSELVTIIIAAGCLAAGCVLGAICRPVTGKVVARDATYVVESAPSELTVFIPEGRKCVVGYRHNDDGTFSFSASLHCAGITQAIACRGGLP